MKKWSKYGVLLLGVVVVSFILATYGQSQIQRIVGLAVAQTRTQWNNLTDAAAGDNQTSGIMASGLYTYDGTNFDRVRGDITNGIDVDVTRTTGTSTVAGAITPADAFTTPTDAVSTFALGGMYNGTTWDMIRGTTANGVDVDVTRIGGTTTIDGGATPADDFADPSDAVVTFGLGGIYDGTAWDRSLASTHADNLTTTYGTNVASFGYMFDGTNWDQVRGTTANGIDVDVTRVSGNVTIVGNNTPADGYTNPTDALDVAGLTSEFNGTTWDRVRNGFDQAVAGIDADASVGTAIDLSTTPASKYSMLIDRTAGSTDTVEVDFECSLDGTIFVQVATVTSLATEPTIAALDGTPCNHVRYNVVTVGSGNTLTVQLLAMR